jgi:hypothetical protein
LHERFAKAEAGEYCPVTALNRPTNDVALMWEKNRVQARCLNIEAFELCHFDFLF